jgi:hypothetical protein
VVTRSAWLGLALAAGLALVPGPAQAGVPEDMKRLIEQRRSDQAYELGLQHSDMLGSPLFDYYFGIAAVDAGRATIGVLALERFMLQDPSNDLARLELGRGYFLIGDYARATREFDAVLAKSPPVGVQVTIRRFMAAMREHGRHQRIGLAGYVEAGYGWTSNANSGVGTADLTLPFFGQVKLGNAALAKPSESQQLSAGTVVTAPIHGSFKAILTSSAAVINYSRTSGYDIAAGSSTLAVGHVSDQLMVTAGPTGSYALLDGAKYRWSYGGKANVRYQLGRSLAVSGEVSAQRLRYAGLNRNRSGKLVSASIGADKRLSLPFEPLISAVGYYAHETNQRNRPDFTRKIVGGRAGIMLFPTRKLAITAGYGLARWRYAGPDPLFATPRRDWFKTVDLAAQVVLRPGLSVRIEGQLVHDDANLALYDYTQRQVAVVLRREWE